MIYVLMCGLSLVLCGLAALCILVHKLYKFTCNEVRYTKTIVALISDNLELLVTALEEAEK